MGSRKVENSWSNEFSTGGHLCFQFFTIMKNAVVFLRIYIFLELELLGVQRVFDTHSQTILHKDILELFYNLRVRKGFFTIIQNPKAMKG